MKKRKGGGGTGPGLNGLNKTPSALVRFKINPAQTCQTIQMHTLQMSQIFLPKGLKECGRFKQPQIGIRNFINVKDDKEYSTASS